MTEEELPCEVCGEKEPKNWKSYQPQGCLDDQPFWAGDSAVCPLCGHLALFISYVNYNHKTGEWKGGGTPQWVKSMHDAKYDRIKSDEVVIVQV